MSPKKVFITGATGFIGGDAFFALQDAHPEWEFSLLVRSEDRGKRIKEAYPQVKLVIGSLDDSAVIEDAASKADIVLHTADSSDHAGSALAIAKGLRSTHTNSNPGYWIHISGTGILFWYDADNKRYGEAPLPEQAYDDLEGVDRVLNLPDTAFHRDIDKIVLAEAAKDPAAVKIAIVCPPTIYGIGRGPASQRSRQIPSLIKVTLEKGFAPKVGAGKTEWDNVHVRDLSGLIALLADDAATGKHSGASEDKVWGPVGYHFAENGTHVWSQMAEWIALEAHTQGYLEKNETKNISVEEGLAINGFDLSWGLNSRGQAKRAKKYLGWEPKSPSLPDSIPELVEIEAKLLGLSNK